jgi:hypothetical protein
MDIDAYHLHAKGDAHGILFEGLNLVLTMDAVIKLLRSSQDERSVADSIEVTVSGQGSKATRFVYFPSCSRKEIMRISRMS